jgi:glycosyltransferase involved in cell wall biosynthesis
MIVSFGRMACARVACSAMRIAVTDTVYPGFLATHYARHAELARAPYEEQLASLLEASFGTSDAYTVHLRELGHDACNLIVNCAPLQRAWAREHGHSLLAAALGAPAPTRAGARLRAAALQAVSERQIAAFDPDVAFIHDMFSMSPGGLDRLRASGRLLVTQIASPLPPRGVYRRYDLILSSFAHFVDRFRAEGVDSEFFRLGFYERIAERLGAVGASTRPDAERPVAVSFVGGIDPRVHTAGTAFLERIAERVPLQVWGYGVDALRPESPLRPCYRGEAWGLDMYRVLASSRITLNRHIDVAEGQANNMRLYEATGSGAVLLTDRGRMLEDLFQVGREVIAYADEDDLVEQVERLLADAQLRIEVARAGQARTLSEHSYRDRMRELSELLEERLARAQSRAGVSAAISSSSPT